jgi:hypothetical protein
MRRRLAPSSRADAAVLLLPYQGTGALVARGNADASHGRRAQKTCRQLRILPDRKLRLDGADDTFETIDHMVRHTFRGAAVLPRRITVSVVVARAPMALHLADHVHRAWRPADPLRVMRFPVCHSSLSINSQADTRRREQSEPRCTVRPQPSQTIAAATHAVTMSASDLELVLALGELSW